MDDSTDNIVPLLRLPVDHQLMALRRLLDANHSRRRMAEAQIGRIVDQINRLKAEQCQESR